MRSVVALLVLLFSHCVPSDETDAPLLRFVCDTGEEIPCPAQDAGWRCPAPVTQPRVCAAAVNRTILLSPEQVRWEGVRPQRMDARPLGQDLMQLTALWER